MVVRILPLDRIRRNAWVGVMIPADDLLGDVQQRRGVILSIILASILLAALVSLALAGRKIRSHTRPSYNFV